MSSEQMRTLSDGTRVNLVDYDTFEELDGQVVDAAAGPNSDEPGYVFRTPSSHISLSRSEIVFMLNAMDSTGGLDD